MAQPEISNQFLEDLNWIVEAYRKLDPKPFLFEIGQKVRLRKGRSEDGQTPKCWDGAMCEVVNRQSTGLMKRHWYFLKHLENQVISEFEEDEIDARYSRGDE